MKNTKKLQRGSATIEAAIIVPVIIITIITVIDIGLILCERCSMQAAADYASEAGSAAWRHAGANIETGKIFINDFCKDKLYWRIADGQRGMKCKKADKLIFQYKYFQFAAISEYKASSSEIIDYVIYKKLSVGLKQSYRVPIIGSISMFGIGGKLQLNVQSLSVIKDPAELIRNIDFAADLEAELEKKYPEVKNIGDKTRCYINQVKEKLKSFID